MQNVAPWIGNMLRHHFLKDICGEKKDDFVLCAATAVVLVQLTCVKMYFCVVLFS